MDDNQTPRNLLEEMAHGSFSKVIERSDRMILIKANTEKVKNDVLREFIEEAKKDNYTAEDLIDVLLEMDEAVEKNQVRKTLKEYL